MENIIFTVRPNPRTGESLWSYLLRLANQNGIPFLSMLNSIKQWERKYVQRANLNLLDIAPGNVLNMKQLSHLTGQSIERLLDATLAPLLRTFGVNQEIQRARFVSGMILDTYRFCPQCLKEMLYYRLLWKMASVTACIQHDVFLVNRCPSCKKQINFQDVQLLSVCPHCGFLLVRSQARSIDDSEREQQHWINEALLVLFEPGNHHVKPHETAMRLLYLQSGRQPYFDRQLTEAAVLSVLPTLLQHARDSLSQKRILHLSFLLNTLHEHQHSMNEFLEITVPDSFVESVRQGVVRRADQLSCLAPWCNGYQRPGTLVKTGTTLKRRKSGEVLLYYLACTECGCEYAIDEDGELHERTYFIEGYRALRTVNTPLIGIKLLSRSLGFTEDKTRRCLAYFCTRMESFEWNGAWIELDTSLLEQVLNNVRKGTILKVIQQWNCWESYQQFLIYRFHPEVMRALVDLKRPRPSKQSDGVVKCEKVRETLEGLLERNEDITIVAVCDILGVCPETIRHWGYNDLIAEAKQLQRGQRIQSRKDEIYEKMETYLLSNPTVVVTSRAVYNMLGIQRTVLWRIAPELTAYIHEQIVQHNRSAKDVVE
ncbi:TniQ family protein [Brevibacillus laterosporus]|uniref:TniQ domain-containing protein n=1 Tax=Brevibacillus laterosporus TaxID=1465 RepID=A0AAP8U4G2_BRELA|nr:TniQ family protein [Brevibacillus laterosporus]MED1662769.1 TniQ family protein [Brevibacillus laterosporus]MED1669105.1 TniQ family protein [Brevibacillus laterosporus]MED1720580.1 TniQ family protein [Brevibacillus laterosporus]PPA88354.1 hypothetical protein C4A76_08335 [Brevibacillus laterosporus]PPA93927.1 hypothetical protein C4A77_15825 [Brevibacillus laterosporus]